MVHFNHLPTEDDEEAAWHVTIKERFLQMHVALQSTEYNISQFLLHHAVTSHENYVSVLRTGIRRWTLFIQGTVQQKCINAFSPWVASVLDSNMNLQMILNAYSCAAYVVD
ncbi:hypothetical protein MRX96_031740 [Rhipicephalus microplus]